MKKLVDAAAGWIQSIDEWSDDAVLLDVRRSIQMDGWSCGLQSAVMVLRCHDKRHDIAAIQPVLGTDEDGTSVGALLRLFRGRGLKPEIKAEATIRDLRSGIDTGAPSIVSLDNEAHWGVVYGYSSTKIYLADPSILRTVRVGLSRERFRRRWDRWAMLVKSR